MSLALGTAFPSGLGQGPGPSVLALLGEEHPQRCLPVPGWHGRKAGVDMLRASLPLLCLAHEPPPASKSVCSAPVQAQSGEGKVSGLALECLALRSACSDIRWSWALLGFSRAGEERARAAGRGQAGLVGRA